MTVRVGEYDGSPGSLAAHAAAPGLDEVRLLYETSRRISTAMDIPGVVEAYLQQVAAGGHYSCHVSLYEKDQEGQRSGVLILGRWTPEDGLEPLELRYPFLPGELDPYAAIMPTLDAGQAVTITDVHTDPRASATLRAVQARVGKPALAMFPLMVRDQHIGLVIMSCSYPHQWEDAELHPYRATAALLAMAIDSRQQYQKLHQRSQQLAILEERQRLARDLHDSVTQLLFSLSLIAQSIAPAWKRDPTEGERHVRRVVELSQAAHAEMRRLLAELRPQTPDEGSPQADRPAVGPFTPPNSLIRSLRQHAASVGGDAIRMDLKASHYVSQDPALEAALLRIGQEALNNAVKHAGAREVRLRLSANAREIVLGISDDGIGFGAPGASDKAPSGGLGLTTMRERAEAMGGSVSITSLPGRGTRLEARVPRKNRMDRNVAEHAAADLSAGHQALAELSRRNPE